MGGADQIPDVEQRPAGSDYPNPFVAPTGASGPVDPTASGESSRTTGLIAIAPKRLPLTVHWWDFGRDIGAAVLLIWSLTLPWNALLTASSVVYVLLATLAALLSLVVAPVSRFLRAPDGSAVRSPTLAIRIVMCAPYVVIVAITVVRALVGSGQTPGQSLLLGVFGVGIAVVPRQSELESTLNGAVLVHRYRLACAWCGGLGSAALGISALIVMPPSSWFVGGGSVFFLILLPVLIVLGLFIFMFGVTSIRIGAGHPSWQPILVWIGVAMAVDVMLSPSESSGSGVAPAYSLWLMLLGAGLAATPLVGGKDGEKTDARLWALVVANAFRLIVIAMSLILAMFVLVLIQVGSYVGSPTVGLIWILVSTLVTLLSAAIGSSQLRADPRRGRTVALICVGVMGGLTVINMVVVGEGSTSGTGSVGMFMLIGGTLGVIVFALVVPAPMRQLTGLPPLGAPQVSAGQRVGIAHPTPSLAPSYESPPGYADPDRTATVTAQAVVSPDIWHRKPVEPAAPTAWLTPVTPGSAPAGGPTISSTDPQAVAAADPSTSGQELMTIAANRADLRPVIATNPSTYPALLDWLRALGDPDVDAALARRPL